MAAEIRLSSSYAEHYGYLSDRRRMAAYERALGEVVHSGSVVADLGCGTAALGMLACRAGAARVYAVDRGPIIELARELVRANGLEDRVVLLRGRSTRIELPEPVDVVVADQMGPFGLGAGLLSSFADAEQRWLREGGVTIPAALELWVAPVSHLAGHERVTFWSSRPQGIVLDAVRPRAASAPQVVSLGEPALLAGGACALRFASPWKRSGRRHSEVELRCRRAGTLHGLVGWFAAELSSQVRISNGPGDAQHIRRERSSCSSISTPACSVGN
jgi:protein arginine N-methyltransferase 1